MEANTPHCESKVHSGSVRDDVFIEWKKLSSFSFDNHKEIERSPSYYPEPLIPNFAEWKVVSRKQYSSAGMLMHSRGRFRAPDGWYKKHPAKSYYCAKPIFHKRFGTEIIVWTPIESRAAMIEMCNLKYHAL